MEREVHWAVVLIALRSAGEGCCKCWSVRQQLPQLLVQFAGFLLAVMDVFLECFHVFLASRLRFVDLLHQHWLGRHHERTAECAIQRHIVRQSFQFGFGELGSLPLAVLDAQLLLELLDRGT